MVRQLGKVLTGGVVGALALGLLLAVPTTGASASASVPAERGRDVVSRGVFFDIENTNRTAVACLADGAPYTLRGRLVGPRSEVLGADADRINVLVHDTTTGGWFWNLRQYRKYDYAGRLARHGETSLVIDRLGYDDSPLADGNSTCLGAHAEMLHQIVQHLRSGAYDFEHPRGETVPAAQHVVVHGHGVGASIAQVEAGQYDDVDALVLMSWADTGHTRLAVDGASRQSAACLEGRDYAPFAATGKAFRDGLFVSAPRAVQQTAAGMRNPDPCGDVLSLAAGLVGSRLAAAMVEAPVLLLYGSEDAYTKGAAVTRQARSYTQSESVRTHVVRGAGSALPLEASAPQTRQRVEKWLRATLG